MTIDLDLDPDDFSTNPTPGPSFLQIAERRAARRSVLAGGMAVAAGFLTSGLFAPTAAAQPGGGRGRVAGLLGYAPVPLGFDDEVIVPPGYTARPFIPWGTPILGTFPTFVPGGNNAADQEQQVGMHHDGMHYFPIGSGPSGSRHGLLAVNHEFTDERYLQTGTTQMPAKEAWTLDMVRKSQYAHGISVIEVEQTPAGEWVVVPGRFNRRITAETPMSFSGPAAGHRLVRTSRDPEGRTPRGTYNNCAHGVTPWGTYLTCEENFNNYYRVDGAGSYTAEDQTLLSRYGVGLDRFNWATHDDRFVVTPTEPNEPNRFGWVVEIDPFDPLSRPVKRTALGRVKHESATVHVAEDGRVVVYTGDDQVNEHVYKFVSDLNWESARARGISPLDHGTLYTARFNEDGTGDWLPLVHGQNGLVEGNGFEDQGAVLVKTRLAASRVGATKMDRPEWVTVDTWTGMVYVTLTNNTSTGKQVNGANPRKPNAWGHIVRWQETGGDHTATTFAWSLFLLAGQGRDSGDGSTIDQEDGFGSPDGIWSDPDGRLWIQTDGTQPLGANDQMLAANPYVTDAQGTPELKRFLTAVPGCEVTGMITTPDQRTMFVNIQHPGEEAAVSQWPHTDGLATPRSATVVITKDDGGVIGT